MTALRQKMIEAMCQRGFAQRTHNTYLMVVTDLARYFHRPPDTLSTDDLQHFFNHLVQERGLSAASSRVYLHGVRFLYLHVLQWPSFDVPLIVPKKPQRIPELLTRNEVRRILAACPNPKHRMMLALCYGCGLRVSEVCHLRVSDIDSQRYQFHVLSMGLMRVRHYGFLANRCRRQRLVQIRRALAVVEQAPPVDTSASDAAPAYPCPLCQQPTLRIIGMLTPQRRTGDPPSNDQEQCYRT